MDTIMRGLIVVSVLALLSGFGTFVYINHSINAMVHEDVPSSSYVAENGFMVGDAPYGGPISVVTSNKLQPFGQPQEDDLTATMVAQPTYSPMVTENGQLQQGSSPHLQGTSPVLQASSSQNN